MQKSSANTSSTTLHSFTFDKQHMAAIFPQASTFNVSLLAGAAAIYFIFRWFGLDTTVRNVIRGPYDPTVTKGAPHIPGPKFVWPFGQLEDKFLRGRIIGAQWEALYGPVYRIWSGDQAEVVITRCNDAKYFYRDAHLHIKPRDSDGGWLFKAILGNGLGLVSEAQWNRLRGHFDPHFNFPSISKHVPDIITSTDEWVRDIGTGQVIDMHAGDDFKGFGFFLVAEFLFGHLDKAQRSTLNGLIDAHTYIFKLMFTDWMAMIPAARFIPWLKSSRAIKDFHDRWLVFCHDAYAKVKGDTSYPITHLWQAMEHGTMTEKELLNTVDESLFANVDVTASMVAWCIMLTATHQEHQERLRAEIAENADDVEGYIRRNDTYLHHTLHEVLRVRPIAPLIAPESATVDKVLEDGFVIPRGVKVIADVMAVNVRDPFWGPDRKEFKPERFYKIPSEDVKKHLFLFGFGPRQCLGKYMADKMIKALLVYLFGRFKGVELPDQRDETGDWKTKVDTFVALPDVKLRLTRLEKALV